MTTIDVALDKFRAFKVEVQNYNIISLTETDTRSKLLDAIFITVLGWNEADIDREKYTKEGYYDYCFSIPGFQFVVEAKKNAVVFKLPLKHKSSKISSVYNDNKEVIDQIRRYVFEVSLQYGVIANGTQFIIGKFANIDGTDWKKNKFIIFDGLEDIENRFVEFYNLLSKSSIVENTGIRIKDEESIKGQTILTNIPNKDSELIRNSLSSRLIPIIESVFGEIFKGDYDEYSKVFYEKCFVENEEIKKNKSDIERLFGDRPPALGEVSGARNTKSLVKEIGNEIKSHPATLRDTPPPKPIIVIGSKGAGKTSFINYLFNYSLSNDILEKRPYVYIDFRKYISESLDKISNVILLDVLEALSEKYPRFELHTIKVQKRIFLKDIKQKDEGDWEWDKANNIDRYNLRLTQFLESSRSDTEKYFIRLSEYMLRERSLRLCLIIDNADQFDIPTQKKVFEFAQSINLKAKCAVVISLREGYYYKHRHTPPFDAFEASNVYHITAPSYKEVLSKRLAFALERFDIEGRTIGSLGESYTVDVTNNSVKEFLEAVDQSLFGVENSNVLSFIEECTYPNTREGLNLIRSFLLSGHIEVAQYILRYKSNTDYSNPIPIWEFIKAIALENRKYYNHEVSKVFNLFIPSNSTNNHLLKYRILRYLYGQLETHGYREKYVRVDELTSNFVDVGYKRNDIMSDLHELFKSNLIETEHVASDVDLDYSVISDDDNLSVTAKGGYYVNTLVTKFSYIDLVLQDTPIFDSDFYELIKKNFPLSDDTGKRNLWFRYNCASHFLEYLKSHEKIERVESDIVINNVVREILTNGLEGDISRVKSKVSNN